MKWVESPLGGNGGDKWVDEYIGSVANIAGAFLGAPKAMSTLMSGESSETVQPMEQYIMDHFYDKTDRVKLFRTWAGLGSLIPKGGSKIWGNISNAPDDEVFINDIDFNTNGKFFITNDRDLSIEESIDLLFDSMTSNNVNHIKSYSFGIVSSEKDFEINNTASWSNPLESQLPNSPNMNIYCLY